MQRTSRHGGLHLVEGHAWHGDAQRVVIASIEHVHQVGRDRCRGVYHRIFLFKVTFQYLAIAVLHLDEAAQREVARTARHRLIESARQVHLLATDEYLGLLGGIDGSHHDACREFVATHDGLRVGNDEGVERIHTDVLHVDVRHQRVEHLTLGIAHVALQLRQQRDSSSGRHRLEHILLPVLAHRMGIRRNFRRQVGGDALLLPIVGHHAQHLGAIPVDGIVEFLTTSAVGSQHHLIGSLQVFLVADVLHVAVAAVGLLHDSQLQLVHEVIERVAHLLHLLRLVVPLLHLLRVLLHLRGKVVV